MDVRTLLLKEQVGLLRLPAVVFKRGAFRCMQLAQAMLHRRCLAQWASIPFAHIG